MENYDDAELLWLHVCGVASDEPSGNRESCDTGALSLGDVLTIGIGLQHQGRLADAESLYRGILERDPDQPDALHFLGMVCLQKGEALTAVDLIQKSVAALPNYSAAWLNLGNVLLQIDRVDDAIVAYRRVVALEPGHVEGMNNLAVALTRKGDTAEGFRMLEEAIRRSPDHMAALCNYGNALLDAGRAEDAVKVFSKAATLNPDEPEIQHRLGRAYAKLERHEDAVQAFRRSLAGRAGHGDTHFELGNVCFRIGAYGDAIQAYRDAIAGGTRFLKVYQNLGSLLTALGRIEEAVRVWQDWLTRDPDNPVPRHMLAAGTGQFVPDRASEEYVRRTFDRFAETYDAQLTRLRYHAPELIGRALRRILEPPERRLAVLDAGCGTGLCGPILRSYARRLVGVDLSEAMLERARLRGDYDNLVADELTRFLRESREQFDVIACGDTLVYFGELRDVFGGVARGLRPGGYFVFSVEVLEEQENSTGYHLRPHGRYAHSETYVRQAVIECGLAVRCVEVETLRFEAGKAVEGLLVVSQKPENF